MPASYGHIFAIFRACTKSTKLTYNLLVICALTVYTLSSYARMCPRSNPVKR